MKELNQWETLLEYSKNGGDDHFLTVECAWRIPAWEVMKEALQAVEYNCPKEVAWKVRAKCFYFCTLAEIEIDFRLLYMVATC